MAAAFCLALATIGAGPTVALCREGFSSGLLDTVRPQIDPGFQGLIARLEAEGFAPEALAVLFSSPGVSYDPAYMGKKIRALHRSKHGVKARTKPAVDSTPRKRVSYYEAFLPPVRLAEIRLFYHEHQETLADVQRRYGVPRELVAAFLVIETRFGDYLGDQSALASLASMAATRDYDAIRSFLDENPPTPPQAEWLRKKMEQKANWAHSQLKALIQYASRNQLDASRIPGSIYGAIGLCQFIPTSALERGVDGDGDGSVNLFSYADAAHSIGNFLKTAGWKPGLSRQKQSTIILRYNNDAAYANTVLALSDLL